MNSSEFSIPKFLPDNLLTAVKFRTKLVVLRIYGTVYNNASRVLECIQSLEHIKTKKFVYIVDNYSTDGTYEKIHNLTNVTVMRVKCSRGRGRQIALEMALKESKKDDLFMFIDLDTIYTVSFCRLIDDAIPRLSENDVFINSLSHITLNEKIPWRDLNNGEDWERLAHIYTSGYTLYTINMENLTENQPMSSKRESRYARGINYYYRVVGNAVDLIRGWGINSPRKLKEYFTFIKVKVRPIVWAEALLSLFFIYIYCTVRHEIYSYGDHINRLIPVFELWSP